MPRHSRYKTYGDNQDVYDDRYDAGEFSTYDRSSRGPSSGAYSNGELHHNHSNPYTSFSRAISSCTAYDIHGYPLQGSYAREKDLRRRTTQFQFGSSNQSNSRTHLDPETGHRCTYSGLYGLSKHPVSADDDREARRQARRKQLQEFHLHLEQQHECHRAGRSSASVSFSSSSDGGFYVHSSRSGRRGAVTPENDEYLAYVHARRKEEWDTYEDLPSVARGLGRGWVPSYEFR